jgi:hypothetical protein
VPSTVGSNIVTVGAPLSSPPAPCSVTATIQGPIIPVTTTSSSWLPALANVQTYTEVDYLAPAIGTVCTTWSFFQEDAVLSSYATSTFPLTQPSYLYVFSGTETDSLTRVGPPTQGGTIVPTGRVRATGPGPAMQLRMPWLPGRP